MKALIIEDDVDIRALEAQILRSDGWEVVTADRGLDGIDLAHDHLPDVIVCDLMLPDIDGLTVLRSLQGNTATAGIPVIMVSAMGDLDHVVKGINAGAHDYIAKPFAPVQLRVRCQAAYRVRRNYLSLLEAQDERKAATESLLATELIQRACLDALEQGVALVSTDGTVRLLNQAGERILGFSIVDLTARFQSGTWDTFDEDGSVMPLDQRPLAHTMRTGEGVSDRIVCWYSAAGELVTLRVATETVHDANGKLDGLVVAFADITAQRAAERAEHAAVERLSWEASHDSLTGLANRSMLLAHLRRRLAQPATHTALLYVDLDHFKEVNDTMGHDVGDELLEVVARRLEQAVRPTDLVARYGGDEFLVVVASEADGDAESIADRILERLAAPVALSVGTVVTSASIGLAHADSADIDTLIRRADIALLRAKHDGRSRVAHLGLDTQLSA